MTLTTLRLFAIIMMSSLVDTFATLRYIERGGEEWNPFMQLLIEHDPILFILGKLFLTGFGMWVLIHFYHRRILANLGVQCILWAYWMLLMYHLYLILTL